MTHTCHYMALSGDIDGAVDAWAEYARKAQRLAADRAGRLSHDPAAQALAQALRMSVGPPHAAAPAAGLQR